MLLIVERVHNSTPRKTFNGAGLYPLFLLATIIGIHEQYGVCKVFCKWGYSSWDMDFCLALGEEGMENKICYKVAYGMRCMNKDDQ